MTRPIKFRAWDKDNQVWLSADETYKQVENQGRWNPEVGDRFILMQFTGLLDKNGKEIYEGDIVNNGTIVRFIVGYNPSHAGFDPFCCDGEGDHECHFNVGDWWEVIGNVHEHPHLLKEVK